MQVYAPFWVSFHAWCEARDQSHSCAYKYPLVSAPYIVEKTIFLHLVENQLIRNVWFISGLSIPTTRLVQMFFLLPEKLFSIRTAY